MKKNLFSNKSFKYGSFSVALTIIVIAAAVLVNAILGFKDIRDRARVDITKNKIFSISTQTTDVLKALNQDVDVYILMPENQFQAIEITEVLNQYKIQSNGRVRTTFVDLDKDPTFVSANLDPDQVQGIKTGDIVVKVGKKIKVLTQQDFVETSYDNYGYSQTTGLKVEQAFTSAIKGVTAQQITKIYFVSGHGEYNPDERMTELKSAIAMNNYEMGSLTLTNAVPEDADILVFPAPASDLVAKELEVLLTYLEKGGKAVFLFDVSETGEDLPNFNQVLNRYYLGVNNDLINEFNQQNYLQENWMILPRVYENEVTLNLNRDNMAVYLPGARSITVLPSDKEYLKNYPIFGSTEKSVSQDLANSREPVAGPFYLGALATYSGNENSKVAVIGNCTFVTDDFMAQLGDNGKRYVVSILNWMSDKTDEIMIPAKSLEAPPLNLTEQSRLFVFIMLSGILPLLIIGAGVFVWIRRKNL